MKYEDQTDVVLDDVATEEFRRNREKLRRLVDDLEAVFEKHKLTDWDRPVSINIENIISLKVQREEWGNVIPDSDLYNFKNFNTLFLHFRDEATGFNLLPSEKCMEKRLLAPNGIPYPIMRGVTQQEQKELDEENKQRFIAAGLQNTPFFKGYWLEYSSGQIEEMSAGSEYQDNTCGGLPVFCGLPKTLDPRYPSGTGWFVPFSENQKTGYAGKDDPTGIPFLHQILPSVK